MVRNQFIGDSIEHNIPLRWKGYDFDAELDWFLIFTAKADASDPDEDALIQKTSGIGIVLVEPTVARVSIVHEDTVNLGPSTLVWDIQAQNTTTGEIHTVAVGTLVLSRDVTRGVETSVPIYTTEPPAPEGPAGPAGPAGPNSVTSSTSSDGTAELSVSGLQASGAIGADSLYGTTINGNSISVEDALFVTANVTGTLTAPHIHGNLAGSVYAHVRAGEALSKGQPVYVSGSHGTGSNLIAEVRRADASDPAKMPAVGIMDAAVANNANGHMVVVGTITDFDTGTYPVNSTLYVANGGGLTATKPSNAQPVARVERSNQNNGAVIVGIGPRYADITNILPSAIAGTAIITTDVRLSDARTPTNAGLATTINAATEDTAPIDADQLPMTETAASGALRRLTFANLWGWITSKIATIPSSFTAGGGWNFTSTTRPTSAGTGTPAANSLITRADGDARLASPFSFTTGSPTTGPWGGNQLVLQPFCTGRPDITSCFVSTFASSPPDVRFVPFWVSTPRTVTTAVIRITAGTNATQTVRGAIYDVDANGMPNNRISPEWNFSCAATGVVTQAIGAGVVLNRGLYWVALQNSVGGTLWGAPGLTVHGYSDGSVPLGQLNLLFGSLLSTFGQFSVGNVPTSFGGSSLPATAAGFPNRGNGSANVFVPLVGLY